MVTSISEGYETQRMPWPVFLTDITGFSHPSSVLIEAICTEGRLPYHSIFSHGMMRRWIQENWATTDFELKKEACWWPYCALLFEDTWNYWSNRSEILDRKNQIRTDLIEERFQYATRVLIDYLTSHQFPFQHIKPFMFLPKAVYSGMIRIALDAGLCSLDQGLRSAMEYLAHDEGAVLSDYCECISGHRPSVEEIRQIEITSFREGHTSSVLRVTVWLKGRKTQLRFALNVARDMSEAAAELEVNRKDLTDWVLLDRKDSVQVYGSGHGYFPWFGQYKKLPVLGVEWLKDALELHVIRDPTHPNRGIFVKVNEFRQSRGPLPQIIGSSLKERESNRLWMSVIAKRTRLAQINWHSKTITAPTLELNHGDAVGYSKGNKNRITFVGSSAHHWKGPIGCWPYEMILSSARDDQSFKNKRIFCGKPRLALRAVYRGLLQRKFKESENSHEVAISMLESALNMKDNDILSRVSIPPRDLDGENLFHKAHREIESFLNFIHRNEKYVHKACRSI